MCVSVYVNLLSLESGVCLVLIGKNLECGNYNVLWCRHKKTCEEWNIFGITMNVMLYIVVLIGLLLPSASSHGAQCIIKSRVQRVSLTWHYILVFFIYIYFLLMSWADSPNSKTKKNHHYHYHYIKKQNSFLSQTLI